jgi:hypothetical protein
MDFINLRVVKYVRGIPPYVAGSWFCPDEKHPNLKAAMRLLADAREEEPGDWRIETRGTEVGWHSITEQATA